MHYVNINFELKNYHFVEKNKICIVRYGADFDQTQLVQIKLSRSGDPNSDISNPAFRFVFRRMAI